MSDAATIGHNSPPEDLKADLLERHADLLNQSKELLAVAETAPLEINDDETQGKVIDLIKKMRACELTIEKEWVAEEAPFAAKIGIIKGTFAVPYKALEKARMAIKAGTTAYTARKEAAEKRRLEEEQERLRLEAADKLRKANEAEERKNDAARTLSEFQNLAEKARADRANATSEIEIAEAKVTAAQAAKSKAKADMHASAADFAARVRDGFKVSEEEKDAAKATYQQALEAAGVDLASAEAELRTAKDLASAARKAMLEAEALARSQAQVVKSAGRDQKEHLDDAVRDEKRADKIENRASGSGLGQTISEHGGMATSSRQWTYEITDINRLNKEALWNLIDPDAIRVALGKWMKIQPVDGRSMPGARFEEETVGQVR